jgi:hypothetical protein
MNMKITEDKEIKRKIMCMIDICVIIHNFLLNQSDWVPDTWDEKAESWRMNLMMDDSSTWLGYIGK